MERATLGPPMERATLDRIAMYADPYGLCVLLDGTASCLLEIGREQARVWQGPFVLPGAPYVDLAESEGRACGCNDSGDTRCTPPTMNAREWEPAPDGRIATIDAAPCQSAEMDCILTRDHRVSCWGLLGATQTATEGPQFAREEGERSGLIHGLDRVEGLYGGSGSYCALVRDEDGHPALRCWGENRHGQLSNGPLIDGVVHIPIAFEPEQVVVSDHGSCVTTTDGAVCWGGGSFLSETERADCLTAFENLHDSFGTEFILLPVEPAECSMAPRPLEGAPHLRQIAIGWHEVCGVDDADRLLCWADQQTQSAPRVAAEHVVSVVLGSGGCVLDDAGEIWCWGTMSLIGNGGWTGVVEQRPGVRVARVTRAGLEACQPMAETDPCDATTDLPRIDAPSESGTDPDSAPEPLPWPRRLTTTSARMPMMRASLEKLSALPDAKRVLCGHEYTVANRAFAHHGSRRTRTWPPVSASSLARTGGRDRRPRLRFRRHPAGGCVRLA